MNVKGFFQHLPGEIWHAIVSIFTQPAIQKVEADIEKLLGDELRPVFVDAINWAGTLTGTGSEKRAEAFGKIVSDLAAAGKTLPTAVINLGIELVVNLLKAKL